MQTIPDFETFEQLAKTANTIPVYREIAADPDTPVSAFLKLHVGGQGFLLESVEGGDQWGRYSVLGSDPLMVVRICGDRVEVRHRDGAGVVQDTRTGRDPIVALEELLLPFRCAQVDGLTRFAGGFVGYLAYDVVRSIERLPATARDDLSVADIAGVIADTFVLFDNVTHTMKV
ncbi:MAG: anthranilate synthase component I, partial [Myxococcales bacterium]